MASRKQQYRQKSADSNLSWLKNRWIIHKRFILTTTVIIMGFVASVWLFYEFYRLLWQPKQIGGFLIHPGAIDLKLRYKDVHKWFAGIPGSSVYPPASFAILWPMLGWIEVNTAIWVYAVTSFLALGWLVYLVVCESKADTPLERLFVALIPLSIYATGATIGNGQLIVPLLPMLLTGLLLLNNRQYNLRRDIIAAFLILMNLVKPTISVPFFWIVLFIPNRLRPALLISSGYIVLTLFASKYQEPNVVHLIKDWLANGSKLAITSGKGVGNLHIGLASLGLEEWILPMSLILLLSFGLWTFCHRTIDPWLLIGVLAIVARFWTYHRWYDDLLILLPMISLFRITKIESYSHNNHFIAGLLLAVTILTMLAPGGLYLLPQPWNMYYVMCQITVWLIVLLFLITMAGIKRKLILSKQTC